MSRLEKLLLAGIIVLAFAFGKAMLARDPYRGTIPDPVQVNLSSPRTIMIAGTEGKVELTLMAEYRLEGVVKSIETYSDYASQISQYDFAMTWGDLNKKDIDDCISYSQSGRWYYYKYNADCPVKADYISTHSANVHMIHKNQDILDKLGDIDENQHVRLNGYLVYVKFGNGNWNSSLTRSDTNDGSCEVMYVTEVECLD